MFVIRLRDGQRDILKKTGIDIGTRITIAAPALGEQSSQPLITGEVTTLAADYDHAGSHAVARGYDAGHRLLRGRRTASYRNVKDSDIVRRLAQQASIEVGQIDE